MSPTVLSELRNVDILDIRQDDMKFSLIDDIHKSINPPAGRERSFPTLLLYNTEGLRLFEKITYLDEYYLTNAEIEALTTHARSITERIPDGAQIVELGSGLVVYTPDQSPQTSRRCGILQASKISNLII